MEFYAQNGKKRPVRLSEQTRAFAWDSLNRKYGRDALKTMAVCLDDIENFESLSAIEKYDIAIGRIAAQAPIRICEGAKLSGAATLGRAIRHDIPAVYKGNAVFASVSHLTIDFETVLKKGVDSIRAAAEASYERYRGTGSVRKGYVCGRDPFDRTKGCRFLRHGGRNDPFGRRALPAKGRGGRTVEGLQALRYFDGGGNLRLCRSWGAACRGCLCGSVLGCAVLQLLQRENRICQHHRYKINKSDLVNKAGLSGPAFSARCKKMAITAKTAKTEMPFADVCATIIL